MAPQQNGTFSAVIVATGNICIIRTRLKQTLLFISKTYKKNVLYIFRIKYFSNAIKMTSTTSAPKLVFWCVQHSTQHLLFSFKDTLRVTRSFSQVDSPQHNDILLWQQLPGSEPTPTTFYFLHVNHQAGLPSWGQNAWCKQMTKICLRTFVRFVLGFVRKQLIYACLSFLCRSWCNYSDSLCRWEWVLCKESKDSGCAYEYKRERVCVCVCVWIQEKRERVSVWLRVREEERRSYEKTAERASKKPVPYHPALK